MRITANGMAGTASSDGTTITHTANPGEENFVQVLPSGIGGCAAPAGESCVEEIFGVPVTVAGDCDLAAANEAHCPGSRFVADLGDTDNVGFVFSIQSELSGGTGEDSLGGGSANDVVRGGEGDDSVGGGDGNDQVFGEAGNDSSAETPVTTTSTAGRTTTRSGPRRATTPTRAARGSTDLEPARAPRIRVLLR